MSGPPDVRDAAAPLVLPRTVVSMSAVAWGLVGGEIALGILLAALLHLPVLLRWRFALDPVHYYRAADLTTAGFAAFTLYEFNTRGLLGIYGILGGMPICVAPIVLLAAYSERQAFPASALALSLRRRVQAGTAPEIWLDLGPAFVALSLLAASAGKVPAAWFDGFAFAGIVALLAAARPRGPGLPAWCFALMISGALGLGAAAGLVRLHARLEDAVQAWIGSRWYTPEIDQSTTSIGRLGRLKLSDAVRLRIHTPRPLTAPLLIQEASFQTFRLGTWSTEARRFEAVDPEPGGESWRLTARTGDPALSFDIDLPQTRELGLLPLPPGAHRLLSRQIIEIRQNALGSVQAEAAPGQLRYRVETAGPDPGGRAPTAADFAVPAEYETTLRTVAREIGLDGRDPRQAIATIERFFAKSFGYSLVQRGFHPGRLPLSAFLLTDRHGHCEYFASATVLLLRQAGIPARYAVGYGVDEYSRLEGAYIARARHAHAWAIAWLDGRWTAIDTTPGRWYALEAEEASPLQWLSDFGSWADFRLGRITLAIQAMDARSLLGLAFALALLLVWRLRGRVRERTAAAARGPAASVPVAEIHPLFAALAARGLDPTAGETTAAWLRRLLPARLGQAELGRLIALYHRRRFRAGGLSPSERSELAALARRYAQAVPAAWSAGVNPASDRRIGARAGK